MSEIPTGSSPHAGTFQVAEPYERLNLETSNRSARELVNLVRDGHMDLNPPYQRASVWTVVQQMGLVQSWLRGIPVPAIMVNDRTGPQWRKTYGVDWRTGAVPGYAVVDGKQRLEAAIAWFTDQLAVPASWFKPSEVETAEETVDGPYVRFAGLTDIGQRYISMGGSMLPMTTAKLPSVEAEAELYLLVNAAGTAQTDADLANAALVAGTP